MGAAAKSEIDNPDADLILPLIALAEAAFVIERGRSSIPDVSDFLSRVQDDPRIEIFPVTWDIFLRSLDVARRIPELHDRLIVATALHLQHLGHTTTLVTRDSVITDAGLIPVIW